MKKILFLMLFAVTVPAAAQQGLARWGEGCILPEQGSGSWKIHFPYAQVQLYAIPGGNKAGVIFKSDLVNLLFRLPLGESFRVHENDLAETALKGFCLKTYGRRDGFVKVLYHSARGGLWLSEKELSLLRYTAVPWMEYLLQRKGPYHPVADAGLNLREKPDAASRKISLLKGDRYEIVLTGAAEGLWAEAEVKKYEQRPCSQADRNTLKTTEEYRGWLKLTDDSGFPNVWFYNYKCQ